MFYLDAFISVSGPESCISTLRSFGELKPLILDDELFNQGSGSDLSCY